MAGAGSGKSLRIVFATIGSFGDLHPYIALALELNRRGHRAAIAGSEIYRDKIQALGIDFYPLSPDFNRIRAVPGLIEQILHPRTGAETLIRSVMMPSLRESFADLSTAAEGSDLLVSHPLAFTARLVAETQGQRWASTFLAPFTALSAHDPSVMAEIPFLNLLRPFGPSLFREIYRHVMIRAHDWSAPWHTFRAELGLPPAANDPLFSGQHAPDLALGLFSPLLGAPQPDWPQNSIATGFAFYDDGAVGGLPPDLTAFLESGPPPLVFTLGTAMVRNPGSFFEDSLKAAQRLRRRAVLMVGGNSPLPLGPLSDSAIAVAYAPFSELFPRAAAIVHHGGVGTTGQAMRAGRPMLVVPFGYDQPDNAARVTRLGIGRSLPIGRYTASRAANALGALLDSSTCRRRAAEIGVQISAETGTANACDALIALAGAGTTGSPRTERPLIASAG
ncbi:glycosyltransferase [Magnetospirillum molischianum]|uniref:Glycosyl transferase family 28 n=1 Tax=Magnetospirillum molischianum DSM 120 TaxID=1150626 RepID=H8FPV0_MAGML|nr:glycosyltransferase [Magnetospirillum molischianum]CCG40388.1 Glycosyl transferase family 28 [Magnetospirillum molischianum DSM 120]